MTGPVPTEALAEALAYLKPHETNGGTISLKASKAREAVAVIEASLQQVTAERDEARDLAYELKLAAAGGEDVPGSANLVTVEDVRRWQDEYARLVSAAASELARLRAEGEAKDRALKPFADAADAYGHSHDESQINERPAWAGKDYVEVRLLAKHLRAARAATAREG